MKKKILIGLSVAAMASAGFVTGCNKKANTSRTGLDVSWASSMTLSELEAASKKEFEQNSTPFKVVGLTSVLDKVAKTFAAKYKTWIHYGEEGEGAHADNVYVDSSYKDMALLTALDSAKNGYFADYALVQDARSFATYLKSGITYNYVPFFTADGIKLSTDAMLPLKGVHFNKLFWTNTNFTNITGKTLYNIWQMAGTSADPDHLSKVSFQSPETEQINMSFLVSCYAEANQKRIEDAYEHYYGRKWAASNSYATAGAQWVDEFINNISRYHSSDGTCMKETQLKDEWKEGYVYYGAFAKMKDAVGKYYWPANADPDDPILTPLKETEGENAGKVNAMKTVKWDWEIDGFNGFMYSMDSQIINNAKYPYTACLFARTLLEEASYTGAIYNSKTPDADGQKANQYGYYYPGEASASFRYAAGDWTKEQHIEREINEDYTYLKSVSASLVESILVKIKK